MKLPPWFIVVKVRTPDFGMPSLWLPVFLLWPFAAMIFGFVYGIGFFFCAFTPFITFKELSLAVSGLYRVLCETRGTRVDVDNADATVLVTIR